MDAVLNWLWQGGVVAIACALMLRVLERTRANVRYVVCWIALLLVVVLPALPSLASTTPAADAVLPAPTDAIVSLPRTWWTSALVMLALWTAWAAGSTLRFIAAMVALRRARARTRPFPAQVEAALPHWNRVRRHGRRSTLAVSDSVTAAALGCGAPLIAVSPSLVETLDATELDRVVIHEWAHVQRRDDLLHVLLIVLRIAFGWHPAVWWIDRRLHIEREVACDELTVAITGSPKSYAACLLKLADLRGSARGMLAAPAVFTAPGLRARVTKIVAPHRWFAPAWSRTLAAAIVAALCLMAAGVGRLTLVEAAALARPFEAVATPINRPEPAGIAPVSAKPASTPAESGRTRRQAAAPAPADQRPARSAQPSNPQAEPTPATLPAAAVNPVDTTIPVSRGAAELPGIPMTDALSRRPETPSASDAAEPAAPWDVAADAGKTVGRKSRDAGVATAGFFSRFGRRVAGAF